MITDQNLKVQIKNEAGGATNWCFAEEFIVKCVEDKGEFHEDKGEAHRRRYLLYGSYRIKYDDLLSYAEPIIANPNGRKIDELCLLTAVQSSCFVHLLEYLSAAASFQATKTEPQAVQRKKAC